MPGVNPWFCLGSLDKKSPKAEILRRLQRARGLRIGTALSLAARSDAAVDLKKREDAAAWTAQLASSQLASFFWVSIC